MLDSTYIEDTFLYLADMILNNQISYQPQDYNPIMSFRTILKQGNQLTEKQGKFVLILLQKYNKQMCANLGQDIDLDLIIWKKTFRKIDYTKSLVLENNQDGYPSAILKFPYTIKENFDSLFQGSFPYDSENKTRTIPLLSVNPVKLLEFCIENNFEIDNNFVDYVNKVEEVWANEEYIVPHCVIDNNQIYLKNSTEATQTYFDNNKFENIYKDMFLARSLGFPIRTNNNDTISLMCSQIDNNHFWTPSMEVFSDLLVKLDLDKVVIVLDRQSNVQDFINDMIDKLKERCYNIDKIRVCFRGANNTPEGKEFNNWIKMNSIGGKIDSGNVFIFKHTVAKWAKNFDFKPQLVVSNSIYESTNISTRNFLKNCHANITVSETLPTTRKEDKIVKL